VGSIPTLPLILNKIEIMNEKISRNLFIVFYISMMTLLFSFTSCGSIKEYNVGTGEKLSFEYYIDCENCDEID
jgi:hypothetical protein